MEMKASLHRAAYVNACSYANEIRIWDKGVAKNSVNNFSKYNLLGSYLNKLFQTGWT